MDQINQGDDNKFERLYGENAPLAPNLSSQATVNNAEEDNKFAKYGAALPPENTSMIGAAFRGAERGALPVAGGLVAAGAGAELGGTVGALAGPVGAGVGAFAGGVGGMIAGGAAVSAAQQKILNSLPESVVQFLGQSTEQQRQDIAEHPYAAFAGELAPMIATMSPKFGGAATAPATTTALQRLMSNQYVGRGLSALGMGGMEAAQEEIQEGNVDWTKVGIQAAAGGVFAKPNKFGEKLTELGASPVQRLGAAIGLKPLSPATPEVKEEIQANPGMKDALETVDQISDAINTKVIAPELVKKGITAETLAPERAKGVIGEGDSGFNGTRNLSTVEVQERLAAVGQTPEYSPPLKPPAVEDFMRQINPDVISKHEALINQANTFTRWIDELREQRAQGVQPQIDAILEKVNGVEDRLTNKAAGKLQELRDSLTVDNADMARVRKNLVSTREKMWDLGPELSEIRQKAQRWADERNASLGIAEKISPPVEENIVPEEKITPEAEISVGNVPVQEVKLSNEDYWKQLEDSKSNVIIDKNAKDTSNLTSGKLADIGVNKDLLVIGKNEDGSVRLVSKPDEKDESALYNYKTDKGLSREGGTKVPFQPERDKILRQTSTTPEPITNISSTVEKKLLSANRPAEEAAATGKLVEANANAWSKLFNISPEEYYQKYGAEIVSRKNPTKKATAEELAQSTLGKYNPDKNLITIFSKANASTAVHEFGHKFLEDLIRFNREENAPAQLKDMLNSTFKWMGIKDISTWDNLKPSQWNKLHEKFADSFLQYLREGVAPNKELGTTFAKFKQWLTELYQTIKNLGEPINEDMRKVFDRVLTNEVNRTTISPEQMQRPNMADIHKADALLTHPKDADRIADQISSEVKSTLLNSHEDLYDAVHKNTVPEVEQHENEAVKSENTAERSEPSVGQVGNAEGTGAEHTSGIGAQGEGAKLPEQPSKEFGKPGKSASDGSDYGIGSSPNAEWKRNKDGSLVTNKLNLDLFAMPGSVKEWLANEMKNWPNLLDPRTSQGAYVEALKAQKLNELFCQVAVETKKASDAFSKIRDVNKIGKVAADFLEWKKVLNQVKNAQDEMRAGWAYLGHALQKMDKSPDFRTVTDINAEVLKYTGKDLYQIQETARLANELDTPTQTMAFLDKELTPFSTKLKNAAVYFWLNSILSGPITHTAYQGGATVVTMFKPFATLTQAAISAMSHREIGERIYAGEAYAQLHSVTYSVKEAISAAIQAVKTGVAVSLPGERNYVAGGGIDEPMFNSIGTNPIKELLPNKEKHPTINKVGNIVANAVGAPTSSVQGIHTFNKLIGYRMELSRLAWRQAADEMYMAIKEGLPVSGDLTKRYNEILANPSDDMLTKAAFEGNKIALNERAKIGTMTYWVSKITSTDLRAKLAIPFAQVEMNMVKQGLLEHTPAGILFSEQRGQLLGKTAKSEALDEMAMKQYQKEVQTALEKGEALPKYAERFSEILSSLPEEDVRAAKAAGNIEADTARGKMVAGSLLGLGAITLAANGMLTGGAKDEAERKQWALIGKQPYSILVGGHWYPFPKWMSYLAKPFMLAADMYQIGHHMSDQDVNDTAKEIAKSFGDLAVEGTWLGSIGELYKAATHEEEGGRYLRSFVAGLVPYSSLLSQLAHVSYSDPYSRRMDTLRETVQSRIPFWSRELQPKYDIFGEEIANHMMVTPTQVNNDPVRNELVRLEYVPTMPKKQIRGVDLTEEQYSEYCKLSGRAAKAHLNVLVNNPSWNMNKEYVKKEIIKNTFANARTSIQNLIIAKSRGTDNDIAAKAYANHLEDISE